MSYEQCGASMGTFGQMAIRAEAAGTYQALEYVSEGVKMAQEHSGGKGLRGTRSQNGERNRIVAERIGGPVVMEPTFAELGILLGYIMGDGSLSSTTYSLKEHLAQFRLLIDKVIKRYTYDKCVVAKATISGQEKQPIMVTLDVEGKSETASSNTFASFSATAIDDGLPYILGDCTLSLNEITVPFKSFSIEIDNMLAVDRYMNSIHRDCIPAQDRIIKANFVVPWTTTSEPLYDLPAAGIEGELEFSNGDYQTLFTFPMLQAPAETPTTNRGTEMPLNLNFIARASTPNTEMTVSHIET